MDEDIKVLLVDDEADFRQVMTFWLESKGYKVIPAKDGQEAIDSARDNKPDIIFLDLNMPNIDGFEALKKIREFEKNTPVILISAYVEDKRMKEIMNYGVSGVFYKGKDFQEGLSLLESALRTHKKLRK